jgi:predicted lipoprotein
MSKNRTMMRSLAALCLLAAVAPATVGQAAPASPSFTKLNARVIDSYVIPGFTRLATASGKLAENLSRTCEGNAKAAKAVKKDFADTVVAWAAVEFLRFGPMSQIGRPERFDFWPDPRGVTQRQVAALIAKRDATALDPALLAKKSAAVQGLSALEGLFADDAPAITGTDEAAAYRCKLADSIVQAMHALAREVLAEWQGDTGWRRRMAEPSANDARYKTPEEPAGDFARALITGLQMIQDREVVPMIAALQTPDKPPRLPFHRSGLSARYVSAGVASIKSLYETMGLGRDVPGDKAWMPRWVTAAFGRLARDAPAAVEGIAQAKNNPDRARQLRMVRFHVEGIRKLIGRELAPLAGLTIGFNELDGD